MRTFLFEEELNHQILVFRRNSIPNADLGSNHVEAINEEFDRSLGGASDALPPTDNRINVDESVLEENNVELVTSVEDQVGPPSKRSRPDRSDADRLQSLSNREDNQPKFFRPAQLEPTLTCVARPLPTIKGHSAFLTFASRPTIEMMKKLTINSESAAVVNV